jgi:hypothetical protein
MFKLWTGNAFSPSMLAFNSKFAVTDTDGEDGLVSADASPVRTDSRMMMSSIGRMVFSLKKRNHFAIF